MSPNEEAAVEEQCLKPESGQSERLESRGRQQRLIATSPNKEATEVRSHDMELEEHLLSVQLARLVWSAHHCKKERLGSYEHSRIGSSRTR